MVEIWEKQRIVLGKEVQRASGWHHIWAETQTSKDWLARLPQDEEKEMER